MKNGAARRHANVGSPRKGEGITCRRVIPRNIVHVFWSHRDDCVRTLSLNINCLLSELAFLTRSSLSQSEEWIT